MRNHRITILLLATMIVGFGYNSFAKRENGLWGDSGFEVKSPRGAGSKASSHLADNSDKSAPVVPMVQSRSVAPVPQGAPRVSLSGEDNTLVSEMCSLHLLAGKAEISLTSQEWSAFATVVLQIQAIRQSYEAEIATSQKVAPGRYRLEIPSYAGVGDALRAQFHDELRAELGDVKARDVLAKLGTQLEGRFAGFGVSAQTLDITTGPTGSFNDVEVTKTITYWNSVEGSDRLTTQREIHYPAYEDPTGEGLSALLAMVKA